MKKKFDGSRTYYGPGVKSMRRVELEVAAGIVILIIFCMVLAWLLQR